jgi:hypothetical protein
LGPDGWYRPPVEAVTALSTSYNKTDVGRPGPTGLNDGGHSDSDAIDDGGDDPNTDVHELAKEKIAGCSEANWVVNGHLNGKAAGKRYTYGRRWVLQKLRISYISILIKQKTMKKIQKDARNILPRSTWYLAGTVETFREMVEILAVKAWRGVHLYFSPHEQMGTSMSNFEHR